MPVTAPALEQEILDDYHETIKVSVDSGYFVIVNTFKHDLFNHGSKVIILAPSEAHKLLDFLASHLFPNES